MDTPEQGWEECVDAAMTHLLRTSLAKSAKEAAAVPQPLDMPSDTSKLKKHITIVCDRLARGARIVKEGDIGPTSRRMKVTADAIAAAAGIARQAKEHRK